MAHAGDGADFLLFGDAGRDARSPAVPGPTCSPSSATATSAVPRLATAGSILDFGRAQGDKIELSLVDARTTTAGDQAFSWIGTSAFGGVAGQLRYAQSAGDTVIYGDTNGDRIADFAIHLEGTVSLAATDFVL